MKWFLLVVIIPLSLLLILVFASGIYLSLDTPRGEGSLGVIGYFLLVPIIALVGYLLTLIPTWLMLSLYKLFGIRQEITAFKKMNLNLIVFPGMVEGLVFGGFVIVGIFKFGASNTFLTSIYNTGVYITYLIYRYLILKKTSDLNQLKFYRKGFLLRIFVLSLTMLATSKLLGNW